MNAKSIIRDSLNFADGAMLRIVEDMKHHALQQPTSRGGNHPLWVVGHIAFVEGALYQVITGEANPLQDWESRFGQGSTPSTNAADYPSFEDVLKAYREHRTRTLALLEWQDDATLEKPPAFIPPGMEDMLKTVAEAFMVLPLHQMSHYGQIADARRAAGKPPLF